MSDEKDNALLTEAENESREEKEEETSKLRENVDDNTDEEVRITAKEEVIAEKAVLKDYEAESNYPEVNENVESTILTEAEKEAEVIKTGKTAPIKLDFNDDFGFSPDDEEVPMTTMRFEPIDESTIEDLIADVGGWEDNGMGILDSDGEYVDETSDQDDYSGSDYED